MTRERVLFEFLLVEDELKAYLSRPGDKIQELYESASRIPCLEFCSGYRHSIPRNPPFHRLFNAMDQLIAERDARGVTGWVRILPSELSAHDYARFTAEYEESSA